jgi:4-diphosphocytidyl-2-C-methyl-D-erythritol kinase
MDSVILSPAKVNLLLRVVSKRPDGYHNIVSIVDIVSLYDVIHLKERSDSSVTVEDSTGTLPDGPGNTVYRAATLLKEELGVTAGVEIFIEKNIPQGAGLGGGSSNAAATLRELARLWNLPIGLAELAEIGKRIGADVPLFLYGKSCVMGGVGDEVTPLKLPALSYIIVYPNVILSTKEVYENLRIVLTKGEKEVKFSAQFSTAFDVAGILENDLERVAIAKCPVIKTIKERLKQEGAVGALMTGSGSAVFGIFEEHRGAREASKRMGGLGKVFTANSV